MIAKGVVSRHENILTKSAVSTHNVFRQDVAVISTLILRVADIEEQAYTILSSP